ncbi:uncharacterized protein PV09_04567 [Verruconis gallopava]|uniref:Uncharacterized protein n=1 Tax=Verruconis gallopava TaxID=253628 RepID=A0A0D2AYL6_9PEZI|nr:uncharacterized protein PV09_04567 [Verruconis gallopava]KIW04264.1 hypothetical protein PV09_04567 [Verruconis gallopava]
MATCKMLRNCVQFGQRKLLMVIQCALQDQVSVIQPPLLSLELSKSNGVCSHRVPPPFGFSHDAERQACMYGAPMCEGVPAWCRVHGAARRLSDLAHQQKS